jgi:hypothetical protein
MRNCAAPVRKEGLIMRNDIVTLETRWAREDERHARQDRKRAREAAREDR